MQTIATCRAADVVCYHYGPETSIFDKLTDVFARIHSPFAVLLPDDDIALPHALQRCLAFLQEHEDYAAAWGYVLEYAEHAAGYDIFRVRWFTPSIDEQTPFERVYHLVRRYQPFFWAVFRTKVLVESLKEARFVRRTVFQETTVMLSAAMQGKIARLPFVYSMRGTEATSYDRSRIEPLFAFIDDPSEFFGEYAHYRNRLASLARRYLGEDACKQLHDCTVEKFFDLVHGIALVREIDPGALNYAVQRALGAPYPPLPQCPSWPGWKEPSEGDIVHDSAVVAGRRYVWRKDVLEAEPRDEITITSDEIAQVERQIDSYELRLQS